MKLIIYDRAIVYMTFLFMSEYLISQVALENMTSFYNFDVKIICKTDLLFPKDKVANGKSKFRAYFSIGC